MNSERLEIARRLVARPRRGIDRAFLGPTEEASMLAALEAAP